METTSSENLAAALKLLEEAAQQKKDELRSVLSNKYNNLKCLITENETSLLKSLAAAKERALEAAAKAKEVSIEKACEIGHDVDKRVHENPWAYIAGAAVGGMLLGYILGRNRK